MNRLLKVTRANSTIFPVVQIIFSFATLIVLFSKFPIKWWLLSLGVFFLTGCLGITVTFHRYLSHRSFRMPLALEYLFSWFGAMGGTGSPMGWVAVHKQHHKNSDTENDPHSPHIFGWRVLFSTYKFDFDKWQVRKLVTDPFHIWLHNYYHVALLGWAMALFAISFEVLIFGFVVPVTIQIWISNLSNWANHWIGYRNFETHEDSRNTWWLAFITWGEGWHNNHHRFPAHWSLRHRWWEFDPSAIVIWIIRKLYPQNVRRIT